MIRKMLSLVRPHRSVGRRGEDAAARFLRGRGCKVLGRNLRNRFGEIDLVARDRDGTVVIVEVKSSQPGQPRPELRVDRAKQRRLVALGAQLARRHGMTRARFRFDIIAVEVPVKGKPTVRHIPHAFESHV